MEAILTPAVVEDLISRFKFLNPHLKGVTQYEAYREKIIATVNRWYKEHPGARRTRDARLRAKRLGINDSFTRQEWKDRKELFDNRCAYCGRKSKTLTVDHWMPLSKGGTNSIENIIPACRSCNAKKHTTLGSVYDFAGRVQLILVKSE